MEISRSLKNYINLFIKFWQLLGTIFYIQYGYELRGLTPFTAQLLSSMVSFAVDAYTEMVIEEEGENPDDPVEAMRYPALANLHSA